MGCKKKKKKRQHLPCSMFYLFEHTFSVLTTLNGRKKPFTNSLLISVAVCSRHLLNGDIFLKPSGLLLRTSLNSLSGNFHYPFYMCLLHSDFSSAYLYIQGSAFSAQDQRSCVWWYTVLIFVERLRQKDQVLGRPGIQSKTHLQNNRKDW